MKFLEFVQSVLTDPTLYVALFVFSIIILFFLFRKYIFNLVDPLVMWIFSIAIFHATILFMFYEDMIEPVFFLQYISSSIALIIGVRMVKPIELEKINFESVIVISKVAGIMYLISSLLYVTTQLYCDITVGFPIFSGDTRVGFYDSVGIIKRIADSNLYICLFFIAQKIYAKKMTILEYFVGGFIFINVLLDGSKSGFMNIVTFFILYGIYFANNSIREKIKKYSVKILGVIVFLFLGVVFILSNYDTEVWIEKIILAWTNRADSYVYFYGANYEQIMHYFADDMGLENLFTYQISELLKILRIYSYDEVTLIKDRLQEFVYGIDNDPGGPVIPYNIEGMIYLGIGGSVIYSFILGWIISYVRNVLPVYIFNKKYFNVIVRFSFFILVFKVHHIAVSSYAALGFILMNIITFSFIYIMSILINHCLKNLKAN